MHKYNVAFQLAKNYTDGYIISENYLDIKGNSNFMLYGIISYKFNVYVFNPTYNKYAYLTEMEDNA